MCLLSARLKRAVALLRHQLVSLAGGLRLRGTVRWGWRTGAGALGRPGSLALARRPAVFFCRVKFWHDRGGVGGGWQPPTPRKPSGHATWGALLGNFNWEGFDSGATLLFLQLCWVLQIKAIQFVHIGPSYDTGDPTNPAADGKVK